MEQRCEDEGFFDRCDVDVEVFEIAASLFLSSATNVALVAVDVEGRSLWSCLLTFSRSCLIALLREVGFNFLYNL